jgi:hypothetical protein
VLVIPAEAQAVLLAAALQHLQVQVVLQLPTVAVQQ